MPTFESLLEKCVLWQIQMKKWGGPRLIEEARSVYLLGTAPNMHEKSTDS